MFKYLLASLLLMFGCGQDTSFDQKELGANKNQNSDDALISEAGSVNEDGIDEDYKDPVDGDDDTNNGENDDEDNTPRDPDDFDFPNVDDEDDVNALHKCIQKWQEAGRLPFNNQVYVRKIYASVTVGGFGNAINDTERTDIPELVLIAAGVNVGGSPNYNLLNPNGFYCMKVNVNVMTNLTVNLHCNARLADSKVNVNVGSNQNDSTSVIGVHVGSQVTVSAVRPSGDKCIR